MSTLAEEGFLSDETDAVVERIRRTNGSWLSVLRALNKLMVQSQYLLNVHIESAREVVCSALYVRSLMHCQAAVLLIERGMDASARAVIRCAMEGLFNLGACANDPAQALAFLDADGADRQRKLKYLQQVQDTHLKDAVTQSNVSEILADVRRRVLELKAHDTNKRDMARVAGLEDMYLTAYAWLCGAVHSSARDLEQHFEIGEGGQIRALVNEPVLTDVGELCLIVGEIMVSILQMTAGVFRLEVLDACDAHLAQLHSLHNEASCVELKGPGSFVACDHH